LFYSRHAEIDKYCREKEAALNSAREAWSAQEAELQGVARDLQARLLESADVSLMLGLEQIDIRPAQIDHAEAVNDTPARLAHQGFRKPV